MKSLYPLTLWIALAGCLASTCPANGLGRTSDRQSSQPRVKVFSPGRDVTSPQLLDMKWPTEGAEKCENEQRSVVSVALVVDKNGNPRNLYLISTVGNDLDRLALRVVAADRFHPGLHNGAPVVIAESVAVQLDNCNTGSGEQEILHLISDPIQQFGPPPALPQGKKYGAFETALIDPADPAPELETIGGSIAPPRPIKVSPVDLTEDAKAAKFSGICLVTLWVDAQGMPTHARVTRSLRPDLDRRALDAVNRYRFKPALKNGVQPVAVEITVEVNFRLY